MEDNDDLATPSASDADLVARVRVGSARAFEFLVRRHLGAAWAAARAKLGDPDDCDDVVQEAFITALERIDDCREPARFRGWLLAIVRNKAHNYREYLRVRRARPLEDAHTVPVAEDPSRAVEQGEFRHGLELAMAGLSDLQRRVFRLHVLEGWNHTEISRELGISGGASRFHLHVARRAVRSRLPAFPAFWSE